MTNLGTAAIIRHDCVGPGLYELELMAPRIAATARPGQFLHVHVHPVRGSHHQHDAQQALMQRQEPLQAQPHASAHPLLRRPFSIYDIDGGPHGCVAILYKLRGAGTMLLSGVREGDCLDVLGPLGKGFTLPQPPEQLQLQSTPELPTQLTHALLIGGGLGIAPLVFLARALGRTGCRVTVLYGANTADEMQPATRRLQAICADGKVQVFTATLDGSLGHAGIVTDLLTAEPSAAALDDIDFIYTCGPEPMMAAVQQFAAARGIPGELSLESAMACGMGACLGCARRLKGDPTAGNGAEPGPVYAKVCKDGPVFPIGQPELNSAYCCEGECR